MCSGRHPRAADSERMQGNTEPSQLVSANEAGGRVYQAQQRVGPERQMQPQEIDSALAKLRTVLQVNDITPDNKKLFIAATRPVYQQFEASIGKSFLDLAIKELA